MNRGILLAAAAGAACTSVNAATAQTASGDTARETRDLGYFLPRTRVAATVHQQIVRCPTADNPRPLIATTVAILDRLGADPSGFVRVDASSGFLSGRTTKLVLRQNGTLSSFNATTQGEGAQVLSAVIGTVANVVAWSAGIPALPGGASLGVTQPTPPTSGLRCTRAVWDLAQRLIAVEEQIQQLQALVASGAGDPSVATVLAALQVELGELRGRLTLTSTTPVAFDVSRKTFLPDGPTEKVDHIAAIDLAPWFVPDGYDRNSIEVPGIYGFRASLAPNRALLTTLGGNVPADPSGEFRPPTVPTPHLWYRRPVPASVAVVPCASLWTGGNCPPDTTPAADAVSQQKSVLLPQLSGLYRIRIGGGNIFGTRQAAATFDEQGAPLTLEYGSTSGGADIATVINSGASAATTIHGAETAALTERLAKEKALDELQALLDARDAATVPPAPVQQ